MQLGELQEKWSKDPGHSDEREWRTAEAACPSHRDMATKNTATILLIATAILGATITDPCKVVPKPVVREAQLILDEEPML